MKVLSKVGEEALTVAKRTFGPNHPNVVGFQDITID